VGIARPRTIRSAKHVYLLQRLVMPAVDLVKLREEVPRAIRGGGAQAA
jgi:hypothetical protein